MAETQIGVVKWFNTSKGFGFITVANQPDIFVHYLDLNMDGFKNLSEGQTVEFSIEGSGKGPRAVNVKIVV